MSYRVHYFNQRVLDVVQSWPADILAHYARLIELQMRLGPAPWAAHARAVIGGLVELRPRGGCAEGVGGGGRAAKAEGRASASGRARAFICAIPGDEIVVLDAHLGTAQANDIALRRMQTRTQPRSGYRPVPHDHPAFIAHASARPGFAEAYQALEEAYVIGQTLLAARVRAGLTQEQVAQAMGTTKSAVSRLESGGGKHSPSLATLRAYADAVGCSLDLQLTERSAPQP